MLNGRTSQWLKGLYAHEPALQLIYDTAPIGLAFLSPDCRYVQINQRLTDICGISVEDHIGRSVRDCVPALADAVETIVASIMATGEPVIGVEVAAQRPDETEERHWITYWHPVRGGDGAIVGVNVAAEEITARKRAEAVAQAHQRELEAALQHLQDTQSSLIESEKLAALGRLVAGVAHAINNPIGVSVTVASALEHKAAEFAAEAARGEIRRSSLTEFVQATRDAANQLLGSLNHAAELVQSFKQVAADRNQAEQRTFDIGDLTRQVLTSLRPGLRSKNLALNLQCEPGLTVTSYPGAYGQVLTNLFLNSVMHGFADGGQGGTIDIKVCASEQQEVAVVFADNGCGMPFNVRKQVFNPFFTTRRDQGCAGLGLHIVHSIVTNRMGGRLTLESEPGQGTRIQVVLPRLAPAEILEPKTPPLILPSEPISAQACLARSRGPADCRGS